MRRKFLLLIVLFWGFIIPKCFADETLVEFHDENLKACLVKEYDLNADGEMSVDEMEKITYLYIGLGKIENLEGLRYCKNAWFLSLSDSNITDLSELSGLTNLTTLNLYNCNITDLSALSGLTNLTDLNLINNNITDITAISGLTNLTNLNLSNNKITDIRALSGLTNLIYLYLPYNNITDITALSGLTQLTELNLGNNNITNIPTLNGLTNLTTLNLNNNNIADISLLNNLSNLTFLSLSENNITNIPALNGLVNLTSLYLSKNSIKDISSLGSLIKLESLDLSENDITEISLNSGFKNLRYLRLDSNALLKKLNIENLENFNYVSFYHCINLETLELKKIKAMYNIYFSEDLNNLENVTLSDLPKFQYFELNGKTNLKNVSIKNMDTLIRISITDCTMENLVLDNLPVLATLNCKANRVSSLENLNNLPELQSVNFIANNINDISPLTKFNKLAVADMRENPINKNDTATQAVIYQFMEYGPFSLLLSDYAPVMTTEKTEDVKINGENVTVMSVNKKTEISDFLTIDNFPVIDTYTITVYDANGNEKTNTEKIGSRNIIKITNASGDVLAEYTVIVPGDVTGNGEVKLYDALTILKDSLFNGEFDDLEKMIRDYNSDGEVKMYDAFSFLKEALF